MAKKITTLILNSKISDSFEIKIEVKKSEEEEIVQSQFSLSYFELLKLSQKFLMELNKGPKVKNQTMDECYEEYEKNQFPQYAEHTRKSYRTFYKNEISPKLGKRAMNTITAQDLNIFLDDLDCKESSRRTIYTLLNTLFERAETMKLIDKNPMNDTNLTFPIYEDPLPFPQEFLRILQQRINTPESSQGECIKIFLEIGYQCRLNRTDILELTWNDIDFKRKRILIAVPASRKNREEILSIPISDSLLRILQIWKSKNQHSYVCASKEYGRLDYIELNRALKPQLDAMKIHFRHGLDSETFMFDELCCIQGRLSRAEMKEEMKKQKRTKSAKKPNNRD